MITLPTPSRPQTGDQVEGAKPRLLSTETAGRAALVPPSLLRAVAGGGELCALLAVGLATGAAGADWLTITLQSLATVVLIDLMGLHRKSSLLAGLPATLSGLVLAVVLAFAIVFGLIHLAGVGSPLAQTDLAAWLAVAVAGVFGARAGLSAITCRWAQSGRLDRRAAIYGAGEACANLLRAMEADPECDLSIVGICDDRGDDRVASHVLGYPRIGTLDDLISLARTSRIDTVIVTLPLVAEQRLLQIFGRLSVLPADVRQPANTTGLSFSPQAYAYIGRQPMLAVFDNPIGGWSLLAKAAFDKLIAAIALVLLAPLLAAVAIAVRLDSRGPVLFRQKRYGFNNELIEVFKFRSMYVDQADAAADRLVTRDDARVTRVGRFIRKTSLDELPQLFNVLFGGLSLVGPRPHAVNAKAANRLYGDVVGNYFVRHKVKPGITGWAQINGWRGETDTEEKICKRIEYDLYYIEHWSILLDLKILLQTPLALLKTDNAY